jgi:hypothetical protein
MNIETFKLPGSEQAENLVSMLTIFRFLPARLKAYFGLDRGDGHNLIRIVSTGIGQKNGFRTLCAQRTVSAATSDRPL